MTIVPSYPAPSFEKLHTLAKQLENVVNELQVDLVDGKFSNGLSWPFCDEGIAHLIKLNELPESLSLEIDCMTIDPRAVLSVLPQIERVTRIVFHDGSDSDIYALLETAKSCGYVAGIAIVNDTPLQALSDAFVIADFIQIMGIHNIGSQGQSFDTRTPQTVGVLHELYPTKELAVDGSVNKDTITELIQSGATRLLPGSAITTSRDPRGAYEELRVLAHAQ